MDRVHRTIKAVTADKNTIRAKLDEGDAEADFPLAGTTKVFFGKKPTPRADLKPGMRVEFVYRGEGNTPAELVASWKRTSSAAKAVDAAKGTLTLQIENDGVEFDVALTVAPDAAVRVDELPAGLADVAAGGKVELELGIDKKTIPAIDAEGDAGDIPAVVKSYDAVAGTILVAFEAEANDFGRRVTLALPVNADAKVRLAGQDAKLADLKERMPVRLRMTADRKAVAGVLAAAPLPERKDDDD